MNTVLSGIKDKIQKIKLMTMWVSSLPKKVKNLKDNLSQKVHKTYRHLIDTIVSGLHQLRQKIYSLWLSLLESLFGLLKKILKAGLRSAESLYQILLIEKTSLSQFVYWAGIYNLILVLCLALPEGIVNIGVNIVDHALSELIAGFLLFTAVIQIIGSRDLQHYGWVIYWEGILRWISGFLLAMYGFLGHLGIMAGILGLIDIYIGAIYLTRLPEITNKPPLDLITGK